MAEKPVKCSNCNVSANVLLENDTPQRVSCPQCGTSESYEDFQESVRQQTLAYAASELGKALSDIARKNKGIKHIPGNIKTHSPKFELDFTG
jgi:predicted RNA-binding Zn-ribbon protein involved in translation (DUF1610 family)